MADMGNTSEHRDGRLNSMEVTSQSVALLGSTGSIGHSVLEIVRRYPSRFNVRVLVAGTNVQVLLKQIEEFRPQFIGVAQESAGESLRDHFRNSNNEYHSLLLRDDRICVGMNAAEEVLRRCKVDMVIGAVVGIAGLPSSLQALRQGSTLLLANKESLVCGGQLLSDAVARFGGKIVPIDSEHSAIAQIIELIREKELRSLCLTASGGPFLNYSSQELEFVTPEQAVKHPRWSMGAKISVDSSTLVNKALELAEACWLFQCREDQVKVVVHPQSIIHSLVELVDGVQIAHLSVADMQGAISYAMARPGDRLPDVLSHLSLVELGALTFQKLDELRFPAVALMRDCIRTGGTAPAVFNAANEAAVSLFLKGGLPWKGIVRVIAESLETFSSTSYSSLEDLLSLHDEVVQFVISRSL
jgi:1-deoxy-D-xylulose-5-phosphate reductoisomerase